MEVEFDHLNHATWECKYMPAFHPAKIAAAVE
jgi:hypothetical protein